MKNLRRWTLAILCMTVLIVFSLGCATKESFDSLDKRVTALEQKQKDKATKVGKANLKTVSTSMPIKSIGPISG